MELSIYSNKFKIVKRTKQQLLCDTIFEFFHREIPYGELLGLTSNKRGKGYLFVAQEFADFSKEKGASMKPALFLWKLSQVKTKKL